MAIVSRALAERLWPGEDPLGRRFDAAVGRDVVAYEVIGVASNARHRSRLNDFLEAEYDLYFSYRQEPERYLGLLVRTADASDAASLVPAMRRMVSEIDPTLPIYDVSTMNERMRLEESRSRLSAILVGAYAALAMALAAVGIYGTLALAVRQRFHEIGIRIALGARRLSILKQVLGYGVRIFAVGTVLGLAGALLAARLLSSSLYGVASLDPARLLLVLLGLLLVASAGSILPARQASRVDPTTALRDEM